ncbi:hypothetical protein QVD17_18058 [Tagetes erecta]|uniref:Reverse transcriptase zinc-binding domain-containing protein n=1 Tax=Tagetes erecta TaxID=13708 RepID=A0AAD8KM09_TARER|nr:hypothetical protein QVD17_18058 [Tagetes erecta]
MVLNRLPLRVSLAHRGVHLDLAECPICNSGLEDKDHIFAYCPFASMVWTQVGVWLKLPIVSSSSLDNIMDTTGYGMRNGSSLQIIVDSVLKSALWCIWKTRNDRVFKNINPCPYKTVEEIKILSFLWVKNRAKFGWLEWNMWVGSNLLLLPPVIPPPPFLRPPAVSAAASNCTSSPLLRSPATCLIFRFF